MNCKRFPLQKPFPTLCLWKTISDKNWTGYKSLSEKQITRSFLFQQQLSVLEPVHATSCMARSWPYGHGLHVDVMTHNMTAFSEMFILPCNPQKGAFKRNRKTNHWINDRNGSDCCTLLWHLQTASFRPQTPALYCRFCQVLGSGLCAWWVLKNKTISHTANLKWKRSGWFKHLKRKENM